jgi:diguanylate cyclase (GGDEF)-like protein
MTDSAPSSDLPDFIVKWVDVGIFVVNRDMEIMLWNNFMAHHSGKSAAEMVGRNLFQVFEELPQKWLSKKINSVFILKNFAFTSWEQRPYLFRFPHNRPITGGVDFMYQNCTFVPVKNEKGEVDSVCVTLFDATDVGMSQTMLKDALESLAESNNRDGLTGIYNRRYLEQRLSVEFDRARRYGGVCSFILFDLDHFKKVNDTYGHLGGDEVLIEVARRVGTMLRTSDVLGRYGGEEFSIILPGTDLEGAHILAERVRECIAEAPVMFRDTPVPVTISLGINQLQPEEASYEHLIQGADSALYVSKDSGRNLVTRYSPEMAGKP